MPMLIELRKTWITHDANRCVRSAPKCYDEPWSNGQKIRTNQKSTIVVRCKSNYCSPKVGTEQKNS